MAVQIYKNHRIVHLPWVDFMACKLHLKKTVFLKKDLSKNVHNSFLHKSPKLKTTQMVFQAEWTNEWLYNQRVEY